MKIISIDSYNVTVHLYGSFNKDKATFSSIYLFIYFYYYYYY